MNIVWHRSDLRTFDNRALSEAGENAIPIYIFDPEWLSHKLVSDHRVEFVLESLKDLNRQYAEKGSRLALLEGNPLDTLEELSDEHQIFFNIDSNHFRRDLETEAKERFNAVQTDAVLPEGRTEKWDQQLENWLDSEPHSAPSQLESNPVSNTASIDNIREKYSVSPEKEKFGEGGSKSADERLNRFLNNIDEYAGCISSPNKAEAKTSHLSPYIRYGCISVREVYQRVRMEINEHNRQSVEMFLDRLAWHQHFNQKIEDNPDLHKEAINPTYRDLNKDNYNQEFIDAWRQGRTGYPLVDASMRALKQTGWLNFRMRAMCASFFSYILKQWWKIGADHFYKHLIDADVAINYYQWQMQSGLIGVHANRIYDPTKQVEDNDPDGKFIRKYVPELREMPDRYLAEPWKMPEEVQDGCGVSIGKNYPEPIVKYQREARKAREFFKKKAPEAYAAFERDEVWEKASLSSRHDRDEILEKTDKPQSDLRRFD
jgi:deoxyribodipyrimidine photo-lyase